MAENVTPTVYVLTASGCKDCGATKERLRSLASVKPFKIVEMEYSTPEALDFAIEHNLTGIPSFLAGKMSFNHMDWQNADVLKALGI